MNCNFFTNHKGLVNRVNVCNILFDFALYLLLSIALTFSISLSTIGTEIEFNFVIYIFAFQSTFPIFLLGLAYKRYKRVKKKDSAEFTYKMFKDWYSLNPKRFVFDRDGFGFHYMVDGNPDYIDEKYEIPSYSGRASDIHRTHKYLVPKTFFDYLRFTFFVERLYLYKNNKKKKEENIMQKKMNNEELLAVLDVVQSDINRVLRDSQDILNK